MSEITFDVVSFDVVVGDSAPVVGEYLLVEGPQGPKGNPGDSPFGLFAFDLWIRQPTVGGNVVLEGPWFPPDALSGSTYDFQWYDGIEPVLSTEPDFCDLIRLSTYNFNVWVGQHVTRKAIVGVPSSPTSPGVVGQRANDGTYEYVCIATNTWKRSLLSTW